MMTVNDLMTTQVVTVRRDTTLTEAAELFLTHKFGCLPVSREDGTLAGNAAQRGRRPEPCHKCYLRGRAASQGRQDMQDWRVAHDKRLILRQVIVQ
jgi:CBS domain-containing protein